MCTTYQACAQASVWNKDGVHTSMAHYTAQYLMVASTDVVPYLMQPLYTMMHSSCLNCVCVCVCVCVCGGVHWNTGPCCDFYDIPQHDAGTGTVRVCVRVSTIQRVGSAEPPWLANERAASASTLVA